MPYSKDQQPACVDCGTSEIGPRSRRCEACKRAFSRACSKRWYEANKDAALRADRMRYWSDPAQARDRVREYRERCPDQVRKRQREQNRLHGRRYYLSSKYGLTPEQVDAAFAAQGGRCAICRKKARESPSARRENWNHGLVIDHDHETGEFRGLLCLTCNSAIGQLQDDPAIIRAAARYVERTRQLRLAI